MVVGQCFDVRDSLEALHYRFMYILISIIIIFIVDAISFNNFDLIILKRAPMSLIIYLFFSRILIGSLSRVFFSHLCHDCSYDFLTLNQNALQSVDEYAYSPHYFLDISLGADKENLFNNLDQELL